MTENGEVFPNAPLVEVAYEVRFPSMFSIPQAIGEFQIKIMDDFPKASQLFTTQIAIEDGIPKISTENAGKLTPSWQFETETGKTKIMIRMDRLSIISQEYNSYDNSPGMKFRDAINKIITEFLQTVPIKKFTRIGLRYIDHCPLDEKTNRYFTDYYIPVFDIEKNKIEDILESHIIIRKKKGAYGLLYQCKISEINDSYKYILDFDSYAENVDSASFLSVTDELRRIDRGEFFSSITENFKQKMRGS
jgi:uncharacterized protein (TIGR04255 family)